MSSRHFSDALFVAPPPSSSGFFPVPGLPHGSSATLHYELRGDPSSPRKLVMIMGAFATKRHFAQLAHLLALEGCEVLAFDNRGVGKSSCSPARACVNTGTLAADTLKLCDHVFPGAPFHIFGISLGGMIAQKLAALALRKARPVASLFCSVTIRGYWFSPFIPLTPSMIRLASSVYLPSSLQALLDADFSGDYINAVHPSSETGETHGILWKAKWEAEPQEWWSFHDLDICASQAWAVVTHHLSNLELQSIVNSSLRVSVHVAENDKVLPPSEQRRLAVSLKAEVCRTTGGHVMGSEEEYQPVLDHLLRVIRESK
ncbi:Alpha/Beta hydrolase protein [Chytriomyces sp. MP71]|nr:Alpha/Beta hydrolase protein [Chytriomyces sp. MP71]